MTSAAVGDAAGEMFRQALKTVRDLPLAPPDRAPAFQLSADQLAYVSATPGSVAGAAGDAWSIAAAIADGSATVANTAAAALASIEAHDARLGAFEHVANVKGEVASLGGEATAGRLRGALHGVPVSVKDVIDVANMPTTGSSRAVAPRVATADATAVRRLRDAGAVLVGKTVTHEFALGVTTPQSRNPWDEERVPGGSSGGSVISVVTGMAAASLGTDTRASIRVPAALSGAVGYKPTSGLIPVDHWMTLSWTIDHFAPMARSVRDIALLMDVLTGAGDRFRRALPGELPGVRIGVPRATATSTAQGVRDRFEDAVHAFESAGATVRDVETPSAFDLAMANAAGMVLSRVEAAHHHQSSGVQFDACTPEVRAQLSEALEVPAVDYVRCMRVRGQLRDRLLSTFAETDVLVMPTSSITAPIRSEADQYLLVLSENCIPWSFAGFPAISLFAGMAHGLPTGIQLVARPGDDARRLSIAHGAERVLPPVPDWSAR